MLTFIGPTQLCRPTYCRKLILLKSPIDRG